MITADQQSTISSVSFYDSLWARTVRVDQHHKCRLHAIERMMAHVPRRPGRPLRILEPGCGSGLVSEVLARYGAVTGIDQSPVGLEAARRRTVGRFVLGTLPAMPIAERDFDLCVLSQVLEHFADADQVALLEAAHSRVQAGGHLIVTTPHRPVSSRMRFWGELEPIENWLDPAALGALLERTGWRIVQTRFAFNFFPVLTSRHRALRIVRYALYDVLRLRRLLEDLTAASAIGDCVVILADRHER